MPEGGIVASSLVDALGKAENETEVFIIGGAQIYQMAIPFANTMYITRVHHTFDGDAFFPEIDKSQWKLVSSEHHKADEKNEYDYTFETYQRINTNL